jgi:acyl-CoA thioesterase
MNQESSATRSRLKTLIDEIDDAFLSEAAAYIDRLAHPAPDTSGLIATMGIEVTERREGHVRLEVRASPHLTNPHGVLHGAVLFAAMDTAMGGAVTSLLAEGETCATVEAKINYLTAVREGRLRAEANVIQKGSRVAVVEAKASDENGRLAAIATGTFMILQPGGRR